MKSLWVAILLLTIGSGCTSESLRRNTITQATTLSDLQHQQVLSNLAMFSRNPSALPWHVNIRDGSAQVADLRSASVGGVLTHTSQGLPTLLGARTLVEQWSMTPVTDDTELKILRVAYRRALGIEEDLSEEGNELANDLAHELKKQTPDFNEFQDELSKTFEDGKTRYRNEQLRKLGKEARDQGWSSLAAYLFFGEPLTVLDSIADLIHPYKYTILGYEFAKNNAMNIKDDDYKKKSIDQEYYAVLAAALSVVNEKIILKGEVIATYDNYGVEQSLKNEYGYHVNIVSPFAAELRRQVKEVQKDMSEIHGGWFHVGGKHDIPPNACYVGQYRDRYAWVCPDGLEDLTQFTLKILNFSSLLKDSTISSSPGPRFTPASGFPSL